MHSAWAHGLRVPSDLSIVAFNDVSVARYSTPPMTVVDFDREEMGRIGARLLLDRIEGVRPEGSESVLMPQQLMIRGSTAGPPGAR